MKRTLEKYTSQAAIWLFMIVVILTVIFTAFYTNITLRSIEKNLPNTLLTELNMLSVALEKISDVVTASQIAGALQSHQSISTLKNKIDIAQAIIITLRNTYVADNLINASEFHAVVAPAIVDLQIWLSEGVSGYKPESITTLKIVEMRIAEAYQKVSNLNSKAQLKAQAILNKQKRRIETLQKSENILLFMILLVVCVLISLLIRQTILVAREINNKNALREQHDLLGSLLQNIPLGIALWNKEKKIVHLNASFTEITGYTEVDLPELKIWPLLAYPEPAYRQYVTEHWKRRDRKTSLCEYKVKCKNGETKDIEFRAAFLADSLVINTLTDVTERNIREKALQESQRIEERSKKMESLGLLAGGVAHDLNNILSGIVSYPELILLDLPDDDKLRKSIEIIRDSGLKAAAIVQDLLTVARGVAIVKEPVNLNDIVNEYLVSPDLKLMKQYHPKISIDVTLDDNLKNVMGSRIHLRKILMNLVSNGCEAINDHSGAVTISTSNCYVDTPFRGYEEVEEGDYVVMAVIDQGSGIAAADIERIFEPFYTKKVMGRSGTGLGLAVVWNVVQDHQGYINVSSSEKGTEFYIYFPVTEKAVSSSKTPQNIVEIQGNGEFILVVDDISSQRLITSSILKQLNYNVATVHSGEAAIDFLKENSADLVIIDMIMDPGINGRVTYKEMLELNPHQKAIIVSGFAETEEVKETLELGASYFLKKPLNIQELGAAVKDVFGQ